MVVGKIVQSHAELLKDIEEAEIPPGQGAFWWMGQHTFIVKAGSRVFYFDPWFAPWESRQVAPLLNYDELKFAHYALVSHGHADHLCPDSLRGLSAESPGVTFFCPLTEAHRLLHEAGLSEKDVYGYKSVETAWEDNHVKITAIKAKHEMFDEDPHLGFPYLGYVVETGGVTIYHAGDTINYEGLLTTLRKWKHFDVMFLPINGRDAERYLADCIGNMTYQEAVELAGELKPGLVVPAHYDMFLGNQEDPAKFVKFLEAKYPGVKSWVGNYGEKVLFGNDQA